MTPVAEAAVGAAAPGDHAGTAAAGDHERACWVAFNRVPGVGVARFRLLLARFGSLSEAWRAPRGEVLSAGLDRRAADALERVRATSDPNAELERVERAGAHVLIWPDAGYPPLLKQIDDPPPVLYVRGAFAAADAQAVAMVGTRRATVYGREVATWIARELAAADVTVVSGLARGIDTHAHRGALEGGGRTVAVLGHGIDMLYPPENRRLAAEIAERGALVSDYPLGTQPSAENFPPRNRIISGLAAAVLVMEADHQSGALITSKYAQEQGRDVMAVPGPITAPSSRGCNRLIQDGAKLVTSAADVLSELNPHLAALAARQLSLGLEAQAEAHGTDTSGAAGSGAEDAPSIVTRMLGAMRDAGGSIHVDELSRGLGLPVHQVTATLTLLELQGRVRHGGAMRYQMAL